MIAAVHLAWRHARHTWGRSAVLTACLALVVALPLVSRQLVSAFERDLRARAATVPVVVGAKGSRFDLVFAALHFQRGDLGATPLSVFEAVRRERGVTAIPLHARFTAQGYPVVATSFEYLERGSLGLASGRAFVRLGEAVVGAGVAGVLGLEPGSVIQSDQRRELDITAPPSLLMDVVGVLSPTGGPEDRAVIVDLETAWVLEGIAHGHEDPEAVADPAKLIGRGEGHVALSGAVVEYQRITPENIDSFHIHGDRADLPLTAVLVFPEDEKARITLSTRINSSPGQQAVSPAAVIDDLMAFVVRIRSLVDAVAVGLGAATSALIGLFAGLSYRVREAEVATLLEIGASRRLVVSVFAIELGLLLVLAAAAAGAVALAAGEVGGMLLLRFVS